jgi:hypothetical protein
MLLPGSKNVFIVMLIVIALWVLAMVLDNYYDQSEIEMSEPLNQFSGERK